MKSFWKAWKAVAGQQGLLGVSHTTSGGRPSGAPRPVAMKMVGHKTEAIYRRYAIVSDADLQEAAKKLAASAW